MSQTTEPQTTGKEMGLIKHLSTRNRQLDWKQQANIKGRMEAIKMFLEIDQQIQGPAFGYEAGEYILRCGGFFAPRKAMTYIDDYTNKKGKTNQHHFNPNGNFVGSVHKLGPEPVECEYNCHITEDWIDQFELTAQYDLAKCDGISVPRKARTTTRVRASDLVVAVPIPGKGKVKKVKKIKRKMPKKKTLVVVA